MVNFGRSKGCNTCKQRRVKCDELKPTCNRCLRSGFQCLGYDERLRRRIRFKDQVQTVTRRLEHGSYTSRNSDHLLSPTLERPLPTDQKTLALNFFLRNFVTAGRGQASNQGVLENIAPALATVRDDSALALAVHSVAALLFNAYHRDTSQPQLPLYCQGRALRRLRTDLQHPKDAANETTLQSILLLQLHDNFSAVLGLQKAARTHQDGALALLRRLPKSSFQTDIARYQVLYLINTEVSSAVRECRKLAPGLEQWLESLPCTLPTTPSSQLDRIGIVVADIQHRFSQLLNRHHVCSSNSTPQHLSEMANLYQRALAVDEDLTVWRRSLPDHWLPQTWEASSGANATFSRYRGVCEIYLSIQVASIWNTWRSHCLIVRRIVAHVHVWHWPSLSEMSPSSLFLHDHIPTQRVQCLVDEICYSIPFYLGSRTLPRGIRDLENSSLVFPAYNNAHMPKVSQEYIMSAEDHIRHVLARGAWHALTPLSQLVVHFSDTGDNFNCLAHMLRPGQLEWIHGQLLRCVKLLALNRENGSLLNGDMERDARRCADIVRGGLRLTSGS